jgi:hypothetical protein
LSKAEPKIEKPKTQDRKRPALGTEEDLLSAIFYEEKNDPTK